ncbi:MAG: hypothetical protein ACKVOW_05085 [Chitinophagaceae bacterium]
MAKPIKETPVLKGKDAQRFIKKMNQASSVKISAEQIAKIKANFSRLQAIAKF